jgi:hypothetical protein
MPDLTSGITLFQIIKDNYGQNSPVLHTTPEFRQEYSPQNTDGSFEEHVPAVI